MNLRRQTKGSILVEYAAILSLVGAVGIAVVVPLHASVQTVFQDLLQSVDAAPGQYIPVDGGASRVCFGGTSPVLPARYFNDGETVELSLGGDQLASYSDMRLFDTPEGRKIQLRHIEPLGNPDHIYTVRISNIVPGVTEVRTGQVAEILAPNGRVIAQGMALHPEYEYGLAAGDEYVIFWDHGLVMDVRSSMNGHNNYTQQDQIGHPRFGDNDGEFDFDTPGCNAPGF